MLEGDRQQMPKIEKFPNIKNASGSDRSKIIQFENFSLNSINYKDKWSLTTKTEIVPMSYALLENKNIQIYGCPIVHADDFFEYPLKSSYLNIKKSADGMLGSMQCYTTSNVKCKLATIQNGNDEIVFVPVLHTYINID